MNIFFKMLTIINEWMVELNVSLNNNIIFTVPPSRETNMNAGSGNNIRITLKSGHPSIEGVKYSYSGQIDPDSTVRFTGDKLFINDRIQSINITSPTCLIL